MCGIAGIIHLDGKPIDAPVLDRMNETLSHRGPDDKGIYTSGPVGLAHRRLTIIDIHGGHQPFVDEKRRLALVYNGEVYNYREIREQLKSDFSFNTHSDTEVVLRAYQKWGIDCLDHFRGMFAFALYDMKKRMLYLVRDRVGIKPLFYYHKGDEFIFASELTALLAANSVQHEINLKALFGYFKYRYVPSPLCIYKDIYKLEPGCFLEVDVHNGGVKKHRYWALSINIVEKTEEHWLEELNSTLDDIIRIYVRSDVSFGAFLSGGVDSSLVTALMSEELDGPVRTFSIGFDEREYSELPFASRVSRILQTNHYEKVVSSKMSLDVLRKLVRHFGEPFADSSAIPTYYVSKEASRRVKMVLSGDGGDELFAGYNSYQMTLRDMRKPMYPRVVPLFRTIGRYGIIPLIRNWGCFKGLNPQEKHDSQRRLFRDEELRQLLRSPEKDFLQGDSQESSEPSADPVIQFQAQDFKTYLVDDILTKVDRMSMANSLEVRVPLLDHKMVELAFSIPLRLKLRINSSRKDIQTKYLLKRSASRFFPDSVINRPKMGFGIPIIEWCRDCFRGPIGQELLNRRNPIYDFVNFDFCKEVLDAFYLRQRNSAVIKAWALFMFDLWMKEVHLGG